MSHCVAAIIPCYRTRSQILPLIASIGDEVDWIIVVDDACPEQTGQHVRESCSDHRVRVLTNTTNQGVGGAVLSGYSHAYKLGADILVKIDGDGQMNPRWIKYLIRPIEDGRADYTKGNRFFNVEGLRSMPRVRLIGNAILSFLEKISSGYWTIFDPTNGFTALSASTFALLPIEKISRRYFFESDMLFRLGTLRACVLDIPMAAFYGDEKSNLKISLILHEFLLKHLANAFKRIGYNYFLRDFSLASIELAVGVVFIVFGMVFGSYRWYESIRSGITASTGTVMLAALPIILGVQFLISFLSFDIGAAPSMAIHRLLQDVRPKRNVDNVESAKCSKE